MIFIGEKEPMGIKGIHSLNYKICFQTVVYLIHCLSGGVKMARYEMSEFEWSVIQPILPQKSGGVPRVDDRRVLNGIFWILRSGSPWADLPERYGPYTTCYNRFYRWTKSGVWDLIMDTITEAYEGDIQMIDGTSVRVHHSAATLKKATQIAIWDEAEEVLLQIHVVQIGTRLWSAWLVIIMVPLSFFLLVLEILRLLVVDLTAVYTRFK